MKFLNFSNTSSGRSFSISLCVFTTYCLTNILRWLPVIEIQLPIVLFCYFLLLHSCDKKGRSRVISVSLILIVFDYFFVFLQGGMRDESVINKIGANYSIFVSFFPLLYVISGGLVKIDRERFFTFVLLICLITAITTILGTFTYESPCRELATPDNLDMDRLYKTKNIGGYGFIYFLVLLMPYLLREMFQNFSIIKSLLLAVFAFCILRSEYTTALLLTLVCVVIVLFMQCKNKVLRLGILVAAVAVVISMQDLLNWASSSISESSYTMMTRFDMMLDYSEYGEAGDDMGIRILLYMQSLNAFLQNPLFGNLLSFSSRPLGGHSEILDFVGGSGFLGIIVFVFIFKFLKRKTPFGLINLKDPFIKSSMIVALLIALFNTFLAPELYYAILIIPLLVDYENKAMERTLIITKTI